MTYESNLQITGKLMLKLLPMQLVLSMVGAVNGIVSSYFATNFVGVDASSAIGLYAPLQMFIGAMSALLTGGCAIMIGRYLGKNEKQNIQQVFSLDLTISALFAIVLTAVCIFMSLFNLTGIFVNEETLRPVFNRYMLWQTIGIFPVVIGGQLADFLTVENRSNLSFIASIVHIVINIILNYLFVQLLHMEEAGLALSAVVGNWVFMIIQLAYFFTKKSMLKVSFKKVPLSRTMELVAIGFPGAASFIYQTFRGIIVNKLLEVHVGSVGISAFATANNVLNLLWGVPGAMVTISRILMSVSIGEEDRRTLTDITRALCLIYMPMLIIADGITMMLAGKIAAVFYSSTSPEALSIMRMCLMTLPLCMPFSLLVMHFTAYGQNSKQTVYVNILSLLDGIVCVAGFSILLVPYLKTSGICIANILNGIVCVLFIIGYAWHRKKRFPTSVDDMMVIADDFGVGEDERLDLSVDTIDEVVYVYRKIQQFCLDKGIDERRAYIAGLSMEEMAGYIVNYGFKKDNKKNSIDIRVVHKNDSIILRIRDDCVPFNPEEIAKILDGDDKQENLGIRLIYGIVKDISYQNLFDLNVLTIRI